MKLLFDSSVWIDHLRHGVLGATMPALRGRFSLWMDSVVAAELLAGCRNERERRTVERLLAPFEKSGRVAAPVHADFRRAAGALSALRARGKTLRSAGGALLDALMMAVAARVGAMVVSSNVRDFESLATRIHAPFHPFSVFAGHILTP